MNTDNLISFDITQEDLDAVWAAIRTIEEKLSPKLITLLKQDRLRAVKMSNKSVGFVKQSFEFIKQNPDLKPQYIDEGEMEIDIKAVETLSSLLNPIEKIRSALDDSIMLSGGEAFTAALAFYQYIKGATKMNVPGAKVICEELKKQFTKKSAVKEDEEENN